MIDESHGYPHFKEKRASREKAISDLWTARRKEIEGLLDGLLEEFSERIDKMKKMLNEDFEKNMLALKAILDEFFTQRRSSNKTLGTFEDAA